MLPLTVDDLLPLEEYVGRRREYFDSHRRYIDRYRRVRIGPRLTLIFENRQTLWFRVQEIVRIARLSLAGDVQQELNLYNRLLPGRDLLQAALLIEVPDEAQLIKELLPVNVSRLDGFASWEDEAALRQSLRARGFENLKRFSWDRAAEETLAVYRQVFGFAEGKGKRCPQPA